MFRMKQQAHDQGSVSINLQWHIAERDFEAALQIVEYHEKNPQFLNFLISIYQSNSNKEEQDYQSWLHIFTLSITSQLCNNDYLITITQLFDKLIALSSPKYCIIIVKSILHRLASHHFGIFLLSSYFHLFYMLASDASSGDLLDIYRQFEKSYTYLKQDQHLLEGQQGQKDQKIVFSIYNQSLEKFLTNLLNFPIKNNEKYNIQAINLSTMIIKSLTSFIDESHEGINCAFKADNLLNQIPLQVMAKFNFQVFSQKANFLLTRAFLLKYSHAQDQFYLSLFTKQAIIMLLIRTINRQLIVDLSAPSKLLKFQEEFMLNVINRLCQQFNNQNQAERLGGLYYNEIEEFTEKIQVYLGSINPQDPLYKRILATFVNLSFLTLEAKQKLYSKLVNRHNNYSFKVHLITQYRRLLNPACSHTVWIRSTTLLMNQLKSLQPNSSVDYIGHIISLAFFWKQLLKRFEKQPNFIKSCFLNIPSLNDEFQELLKKLKQGLQVKLQFSESQNNEGQPNQTSLCLFRISELIESRKQQ